jgi:hypothetical protein
LFTECSFPAASPILRCDSGHSVLRLRLEETRRRFLGKIGEYDRKKQSVQAMAKIAKALGVSIEDLIK